MLKTCLVFRHVAFEDLGILQPILRRRGVAIRTLDIGSHEPAIAEVEDASVLVVLGGPIGVDEEEAYPFLRHETAVVRRRRSLGRPTLGICLGAQLMAKALGARVGPGREREIGWAPIGLTEPGRESVLRHIEAAPVLHWHGDAFELPAGAETLAFTPACDHQAFAKGPNLLGLQFHVEVDPARIESWLIGHTVELARERISPGSIRDDTERYGRRIAELGGYAFNEWLDGLRL
jgi:GMP synthase (glutamine-hydrolysing)